MDVRVNSSEYVIQLSLTVGFVFRIKSDFYYKQLFVRMLIIW